MSNTVAKHGFFVRAAPGLKLRDKKVERLARKARSFMPWLEPSDYPAVRAWAQMEVLCDQVYAYLRGTGIFATTGEVKRLFHDLRQMRANQLQIANALGMTPQARIQLKATGTRAALDLAENISERAVRIADERAEVFVGNCDISDVSDQRVVEVDADGTENRDESDQSE